VSQVLKRYTGKGGVQKLAVFVICGWPLCGCYTPRRNSNSDKCY